MKWFRLAALLLSFGSMSAYAAEPFQAGRHYTVLPQAQAVETGDRIELREFFWYGCPHCYALEPALAAYVKKLPAQVQFVRTPGVSPNWLTHARAFYAFEALGVTDKLHGPFFDALHTKLAPPTGFIAFVRQLFSPKPGSLDEEAGIAEFVARHGVDQTKFREAFNSFEVRTRLERAREQNQGFLVSGVPMLAVDGRYVVSPGDVGEQTAFKVVDFLLQKAARERKMKK